MRDRTTAVKIALRILSRFNREHRNDIRTVLRDPDLLDGVVQECVAVGGVAGVGEDGPFITFIKMILENSDAIIAFIQALLLIFAKGLNDGVDT